MSAADKTKLDGIATGGGSSMLGLTTFTSSGTWTKPATGVTWRDACWALGYQIMDEVLAGTRDIPTSEELLAEMPEFIWPDV